MLLRPARRIAATRDERRVPMAVAALALVCRLQSPAAAPPPPPPSQAESPWLDDKNLGVPLRAAETAQLPPALLEAATRLAGRALVANHAAETLEELCDDV